MRSRGFDFTDGRATAKEIRELMHIYEREEKGETRGSSLHGINSSSKNWYNLARRDHHHQALPSLTTLSLSYRSLCSRLGITWAFLRLVIVFVRERVRNIKSDIPHRVALNMNLPCTRVICLMCTLSSRVPFKSAKETSECCLHLQVDTRVFIFSRFY